MAPLARTSSKRKADDTDELEIDDGPVQESQLSQSQPSKKLRKEQSQKSISRQPTNKELAVDIVVPPKLEGTTRIVAWNVSGLAACEKKGFMRYVEAENPDILIITETKLKDVPANPSLKSRFPFQYWSASSTKGYAGTAILSKKEPLSVAETIPGHIKPDSVKGRIVVLEFDSCYLVGTYVVNAGQGLKTMGEKKVWNTHFFAYMRDLDKTKPVIWAGDLNVAPTELDLSNAKKNWNKTAGYTEIETTAFLNFLNDPEDDAAPKFVDLWRKLHPGEQAYSYFSYRFNCRLKGLGWRIDGFVLSDRLEGRAKLCEIRDEIYGASDHCPVVLEIEGEL